jgi:hypothetical protein
MPSDRFVTALKALVRQGGTGTSVPPTAPVAAVEWSPTGDRTTPSGAPYYYVSSLDRLLSISEQHRILVAVDSAELGSILGYSGHTNAQRRFENTIAEPMLAIARPYRVVIGWANVREIRKNSADWRRLLPKTGVGLFAGRERSAWREFRGLQAYAPFDEVLGPACRELLAA